MCVMGILKRFLNCTVASLLAIGPISGPVWAVDEARLDRLYGQLRDADPKDAQRLAKEIELERSNSESPSMDLLLGRGMDALEAGDTSAAIEHFTALTDHAPDFAEGWYRRALAYAGAGMFGPAVADLGRVLALRPRHYDAMATLGGILVKVDKPEMALEAFRRALEIHPHHAEIGAAAERLDRQTRGADL